MRELSERQQLIVEWLDSLPREPLKYRVTQPAEPKKAKQTLRQSWRVYLAARRFAE